MHWAEWLELLAVFSVKTCNRRLEDCEAKMPTAAGEQRRKPLGDLNGREGTTRTSGPQLKQSSAGQASLSTGQDPNRHGSAIPRPQRPQRSHTMMSLGKRSDSNATRQRPSHMNATAGQLAFYGKPLGTRPGDGPGRLGKSSQKSTAHGIQPGRRGESDDSSDFREFAGEELKALRENSAGISCLHNSAVQQTERAVKAETELEFLREQVRTKDKEIAELRSELHEKAGRTGTAGTNDLAESEALRETVGRLQSQIQLLEHECKQAADQVEEQKKSLGKARSELSESETRNTELKGAIEKRKLELENECSEKTYFQIDLKQTKDTLHRVQSKVQELTMQLADKEVEARAATTRLEAAQSTERNLKEQLDSERDALAASKAECARLRQELEERDATHDLAMSRERAAHQATRKSCMAETEAATEATAEARNKLSSVQRELLAVQNELDKATHDAAEIRSLKSALQTEHRDAKDLIEQHVDTISALERKIERMERDLGDSAITIAKLECEAHQAEDERRRLHNMVQELKGNIRVFCRIRPRLGDESTATSGDVFNVADKSIEVSSNSKGPGATKFTFDHVFRPHSSQEDVFTEISQLVQSSLDGYRVCIFAYGQTGSGKTHTMFGHPTEEGMIPRSLRQLFDTSTRLQSDGWTFSFSLSALEIYGKAMRDLLKNRNSNVELKIVARDGKSEPEVEGLVKEDITSVEQALTLIQRAAKNRATGSTQMNAVSSRSHSVCRLRILAKNSETGQQLHGMLNLVDLAGSERIGRSGVEGERRNESIAINTSLSSLKSVIMKLSEGTSKKHVPYRASKLTEYLQDSLDGDSKVLMFVNVSPTEEDVPESISALRFASDVNACEIGTARKQVRHVPDR